MHEVYPIFSVSPRGRGEPSKCTSGLTAWLVGVVAFAAASHAAAGIYENGSPEAGGFFPISVWVQSPDNSSRFRDLGINTFVGLWSGPTEAQLEELSPHGMYVIVEQNELALASPNRSVIRARVQPDELDNAQEIALDLHSRCIEASAVAQRNRVIKSNDPTRPVLLNFGRGVADPFWPGPGACTGDRGRYRSAAAGASLDIYPVGSDTAHVKGKPECGGRGITNLISQTTAEQRVWAAIETTALNPARPPIPAGVCAIECTGGLREDGIFRYPQIVEKVGARNRMVHNLAPILDGPDPGRWMSTDIAVPIATMVKRVADGLYVFAAALQNRPASARFTIPSVDDTSGVVLDQQRTVPVPHSKLDDGFGRYGVHLSRIPRLRDAGPRIADARHRE